MFTGACGIVRVLNGYKRFKSPAGKDDLQKNEGTCVQFGTANEIDFNELNQSPLGAQNFKVFCYGYLWISVLGSTFVAMLENENCHLFPV